jgi:protein-S-isoprenylcysteine O-methyltransferase Ste14
VAGFSVDIAFGRVTLALAEWPRILVGAVVALAGVTLPLAANQWFRRTGQDPAPWQPSPELIVRGVYRYTRNPMYIGMALFQAGIGTASSAPTVALLALVGLAIVHVTAVLPEESYLTEKFGEPYQRYKASVPRYLALPW